MWGWTRAGHGEAWAERVYNAVSVCTHVSVSQAGGPSLTMVPTRSHSAETMLRILNVDLVLGELWTRVLSPDLAAAAATCFAHRGLLWVLCSPVGGRGRALMVLAQV